MLSLYTTNTNVTFISANLDHIAFCPRGAITSLSTIRWNRKMQDWNLEDDFTGLENAGLENAGLSKAHHQRR